MYPHNQVNSLSPIIFIITTESIGRNVKEFEGINFLGSMVEMQSYRIKNFQTDKRSL